MFRYLRSGTRLPLTCQRTWQALVSSASPEREFVVGCPIPEVPVCDTESHGHTRPLRMTWVVQRSGDMPVHGQHKRSALSAPLPYNDALLSMLVFMDLVSKLMWIFSGKKARYR